MVRSKTNKLQRITLELAAWFYAVLQVLISITFGLIFQESRDLISHLYSNYLKKPHRSFYKQFLITIIYLPKIFIWDRFIASSRKGGVAVRMVYKHLRRTLPLEHEIAEISIDQVIEIPSEGYTMADLNFTGGNTTTIELAYLANIVKSFKPDTCLEIGTFNGRSTLHIALNTLAESKIYTIDLPNEQREPAYQNIDLLFNQKKYTCLKNKIEVLHGDSKNYDFGFLENSVDFVFVDGNHSMEYAINDSQIALSVLRPGGVILWHDYIVWDGVTEALDLLSKNEPQLKLVNLKGTSLVLSTPLAGSMTN